jgi:hypothetical protein
MQRNRANGLASSAAAEGQSSSEARPHEAPRTQPSSSSPSRFFLLVLRNGASSERCRSSTSHPRSVPSSVKLSFVGSIRQDFAGAEAMVNPESVAMRDLVAAASGVTLFASSGPHGLLFPGNSCTSRHHHHHHLM